MGADSNHKKKTRCSRGDERRMKDEEDEMETRSNGVTFVIVLDAMKVVQPREGVSV